MTSIEKYIDENKDLFIKVASDIWEYAEVAYTEVKSSERLMNVLKENNFRVQKGVGELKTAFIAEYGSGSPVIGMTAEYDALPDLSQKKTDKPEALVPGGNGHGCGHNLLGTAGLAGALAIKDAMDKGLAKGTLRLYGTPAEEVLTGKVYMAKQGVFDSCDCILAWHPEGVNAVFETSTSANCNVKFHFHGKTAHAASDPFNGRSALDAVELMNVAANYLREHVIPGTKIHYATIAPNLVPNIVPDKASVWYFIRGVDNSVIKDVYERIVHCASGAAEMTGTTFDIEYLGGCADYMPNRTLNKVLWEEMSKVPVPKFTKEEHEFARVVGEYTAANGERFRDSLESAYGVNARKGYICEFLAPLSEIKAKTTIGGSLDLGDVSRIVPTTMFTAIGQGFSCGSHGWQCTTFSASTIGMKGMLYAAKVFGNLAVRLMNSPEIIKQAKEEFETKTKGVKYQTNLPDDWKPGK